MPRHGFTLLELVVAVLAVLFLLFILVLVAEPRDQRGRLTRRALCAANIRGLGQSCLIYAYDFDGSWPVAPHDPTRFTTPSTIGTHRTDGDQAHADPSVGQSLWILMQGGAVTSKHFICPTSPDQCDSTTDPRPFFDFEGPNVLSYAYQHPYGPSGIAMNEGDLDPGLPMIADKVFTAVGPDFRGRRKPDFNTWSQGQWQWYVYPHHKGEGQNVLYADGHASFERTPACGLQRVEFPRGRPYVHNDLIYENADGIYAGREGGWRLDPNDAVLLHSPR